MTPSRVTADTNVYSAILLVQAQIGRGWIHFQSSISHNEAKSGLARRSDSAGSHFNAGWTGLDRSNDGALRWCAKGWKVKASAVKEGLERPLDQGGVFASPLRYPGGKGRMGPWLATVMRTNKLRGGCYVEPYAGGAGAALYLLTTGIAGRIVINDADPAIYAFWNSVVNDTDALVEKIRKTQPTLDARAKAKSVIEAPNEHSELDVAFSAFLLNRTSRSGILNGGVIGGKAQDGSYKLDARYNRESLIARIQAIGALREKISVYGMDALLFLATVGTRLPPKRVLIYLDPPYYVKGSQLYRNCYRHDDHVEVAEAVMALSRPVIVTYDDAAPIRKMYQGMQWTLFSLTYSTHLERPLASEVLFYNNLKLPMPPTLTRAASLPDQK